MAKGRIRLTQGRIDGAACPDGRQQGFIRDLEQPGLALRVTASGNKGYVYEGKLDGKTIRVTVGDPKTLTLSQARDRAAAIRVMIRAGRDPRIIKAERMADDANRRDKAKQESAAALDAWDAYIKARARKWSARHKADHQTMSRAGGETITRGRRHGMSDTKEPGILRPLLERPLSEITRDRIAVWLEVQAPRRPTRARLALSLLATFINWCTDRPEYRDQVHADACLRMKKDLPKAQTRDDCLQHEQLALWFEHVRTLQNPVIAAYLQALLLTGARRNELAALTWADVDFQWASMTIHDKVEDTRTIPLTPYIKSLLLGLQRINNTPPNVLYLERLREQGKKWKPSPWIFSSPTAASGRIQEPRIAHNRALQAAGLPALSIHGLRRSFGTLAEWVECPAGVVAQIMGHKPSAIAEKHYRRRPLDLLRMWHTKIEGWILEQAGIEQPKEKATRLRAMQKDAA
ncbi:MAG: DUF4102 domain-containing protein [Candidimonas sp.]|nr:MAG: DUF4102 domain-containing protein [Candidimonas sp.]TAM22294.1 MAG: DUF4102 domain-containing protein [Candidimonas sp.]TAM80182.1 MAG: DUF4102 domain-containing protein [Candidimonas sp.]